MASKSILHRNYPLTSPPPHTQPPTSTHLKDCGFDVGDGKDVIYLAAVEVGQADGADQTLLHQFLHGSPGQLIVNVVIQQGAILASREWSVSPSWRTDRKKLGIHAKQ